MAKTPKKGNALVDKHILKRGPYSFRVRMMIGGHKINKTFDTLAEAQNYRDLERVGASLDHTEGAIYAARVKKRESKTYTFKDAIKDYRPISEKKRGALQEGASLDLLARLPIAVKPIYMIHGEDLVSMFKDIKSGKYRKIRESIKKPKSLKPCSEATARRYSNLARHIFQVAKDEWKKLDVNPFDDLAASERQNDGKPRDRRFKGDEFERLKKILDPETSAALIVLVESAMRRGELLGLEWQHVKFNGKLGTAHLPKTKNNEARTVPLSSIAISALKSLLPKGARPISGKVFTLTTAILNHRWREAREAIGAPDLRLHDLRHEATSRLFEDKGFNVVEASAVTGHKSLQMLKRYAHLNPDLLAKKLG